MKFNLLYLFFSITMLVFFLIIVLFPYIIIGGSSLVPSVPGASRAFGSYIPLNWAFALIWLLLFVPLNLFYFANREIFNLLEKEDWPALVRCLENRVIRKGQYSQRLVRLLANSYLVLSDSAGVISLENRVSLVKPALVDANALIFGSARILAKDIPGALRFFEIRQNTVKTGTREWIKWYYGFSLFLSHKYQDGGEEFSLLASLSRDSVVTALASYFLLELLGPILPDKRIEYREVAFAGRDRVRNALPGQKDWDRKVSRLCTEIHGAALIKYLDDTRNWVYGA